MLIDKTLVWLLLSYVLFQLAALFLGVGLFLFAYLIVYIIAIIYSATKTAKAIVQTGSIRLALYPLLAFLLANIVLFIVYLPTLIYNPNINWKLKGEVEQDPMILQAYVPPVFFCMALLIFLLTTLVTKGVSRYRSRMRTS